MSNVTGTGARVRWPRLVRAQGLAEYAILSLVAIGVLLSLVTFRDALTMYYQYIAAQIP
jgi:hypothetical protein